MHINDRLADWCLYISTEHNRRKDWKGVITIKHPITKNSANEEPQDYIKGQWPMENQFFVSLCSFICLQALYQLSGPVCKSTWRYSSFFHASHLHFTLCVHLRSYNFVTALRKQPTSLTNDISSICSLPKLKQKILSLLPN